MHILVYPTFLIGLGEYLKKKKKRHENSRSVLKYKKSILVHILICLFVLHTQDIFIEIRIHFQFSLN